MQKPSTEGRYVPYTEFLDLFPAARRSAISNQFLSLIRAGITHPTTLCDAVWDIAVDHHRQGYDLDLVDEILSDPSKVLRYAQDRIAYEQLPLAEKLALKLRQLTCRTNRRPGSRCSTSESSVPARIRPRNSRRLS